VAAERALLVIVPLAVVTLLQVAVANATRTGWFLKIRKAVGESHRPLFCFLIHPTGRVNFLFSMNLKSSRLPQAFDQGKKDGGLGDRTLCMMKKVVG
jgi:hypothetical protein